MHKIELSIYDLNLFIYNIYIKIRFFMVLPIKNTHAITYFENEVNVLN